VLALAELSAERQATAEPRGSGSALLIVVRRGETGVFRTVHDVFGRYRRLDVIWDRRLAERRTVGSAAPADRRRSERRRPPPEAWSALGFTVLVQPAGPEPA
jgi:hypothetical protein